jgi:hypothetical protein
LRPEESSRAMQIQKLQVRLWLRRCLALDCRLQDTPCIEESACQHTARIGLPSVHMPVIK